MLSGHSEKNKKHWPFRGERKDKKGMLKQKQCGNLLATKWTDKQEVNILSTCAPAGNSNVQRRSKNGPIQVEVPTAVKLYNERMGGVDLADQYRCVVRFFFLKKIFHT